MAGMDDQQGKVTRLGPDSGGRDPGEPTVRVYSWEWGTGEGRQPGLPWIGIFLLVFGGLLLIQQLFPDARALGSLLFMAIGLAFLVKWAIDRGTGSLYAGAIITALAAPGLIEEATNATYDGLGTLCLGIAFLFIAAVRAATSGGIGWQAALGGLLAVIGVAEMVTLGIGDLVVPIVLVLLGGVLILRGSAAAR
jgi:putative exporter of polyketide antibiotics